MKLVVLKGFNETDVGPVISPAQSRPSNRSFTTLPSGSGNLTDLTTMFFRRSMFRMLSLDELV
jgi:hypothetical protein